MLTSSTVTAAITQAGLEVRWFVSSWLGGHSHDQGKFSVDENGLLLMFILITVLELNAEESKLILR